MRRSYEELLKQVRGAYAAVQAGALRKRRPTDADPARLAALEAFVRLFAESCGETKGAT